MFVSLVAVSLRIPGPEKESCIKITSLVYDGRVIEVCTMAKLVRVLRKFGIVVSNLNRPFMFF